MINKDVLPILDKLISFQSVTPKGEDALQYIAELLSKLGFECHLKNFGSGAKETSNLYAVLGDCAPNICFAGHVDVVPPMSLDLWNSDPFKMTVKDDIIYGRGTVDMKGALACGLAATLEFFKQHKPTGSISFLLTSDEEGDATYGTKMMLEHIKNYTPKIDLCLLGEPTTKKTIGDTIKIGRRGSVNFALTVSGKQGHVAYPEKAINPIPIMTNILKDLSEKEFDSGSEFFQKSNLEITSVDTGNQVTNVIVQSLSAKFNIRFNEKHTAASLNSEIEQIVKKHCDNYDLQYSSSSAPFIQKYSERMKKFTQIVQDNCGVIPDVETGGGTSDARFIHPFAEVVEFGLNCDPAHKINEHTKISDLQILYNVYYDSLVEFLTQR
ncbi:MAG: succinyl-diaminopimelate desuccinylase [Rickettsiales bacterium]|nr:MAG: succinyl-diaminopimelate desuccinylase [Rickettsiales bacterium]